MIVEEDDLLVLPPAGLEDLLGQLGQLLREGGRAGGESEGKNERL